MEIVKDEVKELQKAESINAPAPLTRYNPNKKYTWEKTDTFVVSGAEFGVLINSLRAIMATEEAQRILLAERAANMLDDVLAKAVESGQVKESPPEKGKSLVPMV